MSKFINTFSFTVLFFSFYSCSGLKTNKNCQVVRAAFDVGSGSTKMKVAKVDVCEGGIVNDKGQNVNKPLK